MTFLRRTVPFTGLLVVTVAVGWGTGRSELDGFLQPPWTLLAATAAFLAVSLAYGNRLLKLLTPRLLLDPLEELVFSLGIGLGAVSIGTFVLGELQLLNRGFFQAVSLVLSVGAIWLWKPGLSHLEALRNFRAWGGSERTVAVLLAVFGTTYLAAGLAPETEFDALNYHLGMPRLYLNAGGMDILPNLFYSTFPQTVEMLYTFGWLVHSPALSKMLHLLFGLASAIGVAMLARRFHPSTSGGPAALIFLSIPVVGFLSGTAYVDLGLAFFFLLALYAAVRAACGGMRAWWVLCGIFSGLALGTKYTAVLLLPLLAAAILALWIAPARLRLSRHRRLNTLSDLTVAGAIAAGLWSLWLFRNWLATGNPVAPLMAQWLPSPILTASDSAMWEVTVANWGAVAEGIAYWGQLGWRLVFAPQLQGGSIGLAFLMLLFWGVVQAIRGRERFLAALALGGIAIHTLLTPQVRLLTPVLALSSVWLGVVVGVRIESRRDELLRRIVLAVAVLSMVLQSPFGPLAVRFGSAKTRQAGALSLLPFETKRAAWAEKLGALPAGHSRLESSGDGAIFSLTPAYQALLRRPLYMAPNSSAAINLTRLLLDTALNRSGPLVTEQFTLDSETWSRAWRVRMDASRVRRLPEFYLPRFYYRRDGYWLEVSGGRIQRSLTDDLLEVTVRFPQPLPVEQVRIWLDPTGRGDPTGGDFAISKRVEGRWQEVPLAGHTTAEPQAVSLENLAARFRAHSIRYLVYSELPILSFLDAFFAEPDVRKLFPPEAVIGDRRFYRIASPE